MKKKIQWETLPQQESLELSRRQKITLFIIIVFMLLGTKIPEEFRLFYYFVLFLISSPFLIICAFFFIAFLKLKLSREYGSRHIYSIDENGINISYADKNRIFPWSNIAGWSGSIEEMKADNFTVSSTYNEPETAIFIMLKNKRRELIKFSPLYFEPIVQLLNQHTKHLTCEEVSKMLL